MFLLEPSPRIRMITLLSLIRREWQQAANGGSLLDVEANVGLFFVDLVNGLGVAIDERYLVLGFELFDEVQEFLTPRSQD